MSRGGRERLDNRDDEEEDDDEEEAGIAWKLGAEAEADEAEPDSGATEDETNGPFGRPRGCGGSGL